MSELNTTNPEGKPEDLDIDLTAADEEYRTTEAAPDEFAPLNGRFIAFTDRCYLKLSKSKKIMLAMEMTVKAPKYAGRKLFKNLVLQGDSLQYSKKELKRVNFDYTPTEMQAKLDEIVSKYIEVNVKTVAAKDGEQYDQVNVYLNKIVNPSAVPALAEEAAGVAAGDRPPF